MSNTINKGAKGASFFHTVGPSSLPPPAAAGTVLIADGCGGAQWNNVQEQVRNRFYNDLVYAWDPIDPHEEARLPKVIGETFTALDGKDIFALPRPGKVYIRCTIIVYCPMTTHWRGGHPINFYDCTFIRFEPMSVLEHLAEIEP